MKSSVISQSLSLFGSGLHPRFSRLPSPSCAPLLVSLLLQREVVSAFFEAEPAGNDEGVEDAFELLHEVSERVRTGVWVGDCFIYNNSAWRLNYCVGGEVSSSLSLSLLLLEVFHAPLTLPSMWDPHGMPTH